MRLYEKLVCKLNARGNAIPHVLCLCVSMRAHYMQCRGNSGNIILCFWCVCVWNTPKTRIQQTF